MRVSKFSELRPGDKFVQSSAFLKDGFPDAGNPFSDDDLVVMEKVDNGSVKLCYNGRVVTNFPDSPACVKVRL